MHTESRNVARAARIRCIEQLARFSRSVAAHATCIGLVFLVAAGCADDRSANPSTTTVMRAPEALFDAAKRGDVEQIRRLVADGADLAAVDDASRTPLLVAAYAGHVEAARVMIEAGADVNIKDRTQQSAYLIATSEIGETAGVELLRITLEHGADITSLDSYNGTGLIRAADRGFVRIVDELLAAGVDIDHVNRLGWTALLEAIILGRGDAAHTEVVRRLVESGADVNRADGNGVRPLAHAVDRGYTEMASILRGAGGR